MLSASAFNALLKTLEEPPEHVVFILATTELQKLPATITSRCQRFDFRRISTDDIAGKAGVHRRERGYIPHARSRKLIGRLSLGGMRDAISLLELCAGSGKTVDIPVLVNSAAGVSGRENVSQTVAAVIKKNNPAIFGIIGDFRRRRSICLCSGRSDPYYRDMLVMRTSPDSRTSTHLTEDE